MSTFWIIILDITMLFQDLTISVPVWSLCERTAKNAFRELSPWDLSPSPRICWEIVSDRMLGNVSKKNRSKVATFDLRHIKFSQKGCGQTGEKFLVGNSNLGQGPMRFLGQIRLFWSEGAGSCAMDYPKPHCLSQQKGAADSNFKLMFC